MINILNLEAMPTFEFSQVMIIMLIFMLLTGVAKGSHHIADKLAKYKFIAFWFRLIGVVLDAMTANTRLRK